MSDEDDWETAAVVTLGTKANWDDEEDLADKVDPKAEEEAKVAAAAATKKKKDLKAKLRAKEEEEARLAADQQARGMDRRGGERVVQEADYENIQDMLGGGGGGQAAGGSSFETKNPNKKEEFEDFARYIGEHVRKFQGHYFYPTFARSLTRELCLGMKKADDIKEVLNMVTVFHNEKLKEIREAQKGPTKKKQAQKKQAAVVERGDFSGFGSVDDYAEEEFGDDDFM